MDTTYLIIFGWYKCIVQSTTRKDKENINKLNPKKKKIINKKIKREEEKESQ